MLGINDDSIRLEFDKLWKYADNAKLRSLYYMATDWEDGEARIDFDFDIRYAYYEHNGFDDKYARDDEDWRIRFEYHRSRYWSDLKAKNDSSIKIRKEFYRYYNWKDIGWYSECREIQKLGLEECFEFERCEEFDAMIEKAISENYLDMPGGKLPSLFNALGKERCEELLDIKRSQF